ncbi:MAG: MFS transporter [Clostridium sp.]|nr:MFS transporter [Clostridium sp.]
MKKRSVKTDPEKVQRELARLRAEKAKPKAPGYMIYFLLVITVIYCADTITSDIGTQMQSILASQIFAPVVGEEFAVARMSALGFLATVAGGLALFYKPLADRFGRKIFLVINTFGMGLGLVLVGLATNIPVYLIGACVIGFFVPHDMQLVYILESTPPKHRAKLTATVKGLATLAILLVPVLRNVFIKGTDMSNWRYIYFIPAAATVVIAILAIFLIRESDAFVDNRIHMLTMTEEEKEEARQKKQDVDSQGGFFKALKFAFTHKQLLWIAISQGLFMFGMVITTYYETVMTYGFSQQFLAEDMAIDAAKGEASMLVTKALLLFPFSNAICQILQGFIADGIGRKRAAVVMSVITIVSFSLFFLGANLGWNPYIVGLLSGAAIGGYWSASDLFGLMETESVPTNLRSSAISALPIISGVIYSVSLLASMILNNVLGDAKIGIICLLIAVPGMIISLIILSAKVKETKGVDLSNIHGDEFEN